MAVPHVKNNVFDNRFGHGLPWVHPPPTFIRKLFMRNETLAGREKPPCQPTYGPKGQPNDVPNQKMDVTVLPLQKYRTLPSLTRPYQIQLDPTRPYNTRPNQTLSDPTRSYKIHQTTTHQTPPDTARPWQTLLPVWLVAIGVW